MITKEELKLYFEKGDQPTQNQFWEWMDSYWHKEEKIPQDAVETFEKVIPLFDGDKLMGSSIALTIPKNTKQIYNSSYSYEGGNYQITKVVFNEGLEIIGIGAFHTQNIKSIKTPSTLKIIENSAFANQGNSINGNDSIEEIILNEGLEIIGDSAFTIYKSPKIKNLYIPNTVQSVGQNAFYIPSLKTVSAPAGLDLSTAGIPATAVITYRDLPE
ncbi:leucine-rich repeat domain-containing protein [Chryseobacterium gambrini]|uniref:leucine-rich repeat domain-containing protein n=1 Tax=Chryseobacterium gambrini TaxID=373672 RepID=UPI0022F388AD|nr:leucine-rich repeat domain-containing protein [Chryseobacterium gambrini]WBX95489.1 leucine-rich repeat domain-containing protein [Chryseobacterium gambrini]